MSIFYFTEDTMHSLSSPIEIYALLSSEVQLLKNAAVCLHFRSAFQSKMENCTNAYVNQATSLVPLQASINAIWPLETNSYSMANRNPVWFAAST